MHGSEGRCGRRELPVGTFAALQQREWVGSCRTEYDWWNDDKGVMSASTRTAESKFESLTQTVIIIFCIPVLRWETGSGIIMSNDHAIATSSKLTNIASAS
jgi:hypothetical protein